MTSEHDGGQGRRRRIGRRRQGRVRLPEHRRRPAIRHSNYSSGKSFFHLSRSFSSSVLSDAMTACEGVTWPAAALAVGLPADLHRASICVAGTPQGREFVLLLKVVLVRQVIEVVWVWVLILSRLGALTTTAMPPLTTTRGWRWTGHHLPPAQPSCLVFKPPETAMYSLVVHA